MRCSPGAFIVTWWVDWTLQRWVKVDNEWKFRAYEHSAGVGPATSNQGPYRIGSECRHLTNLLEEPDKIWRTVGILSALGERPPTGKLTATIPATGVTDGKKLPCG